MSRPFTDDSIPRVAPLYRMQWEEAQNCHVLLYPEGMVKLSGSAGEIMKRVDGKTSVAGLLDALQAQFPGVPLTQDVYQFLEVAYGNGWLRNIEPK
jgi:pyrroloquinoline quinone biosynthesis protein D